MNILIFGAPGSGESTLGQALADATGFFYMDTDDYFWLETPVPYSQRRNTEEGLSMMLHDIETHSNCVISGPICGWGDILIPFIDLSVRLNTDTALRIKRICEREARLFGHRTDPGGDMHCQFWEFLAAARQYDTAGHEVRSLAQHMLWEQNLICDKMLLDGGNSVTVNVNAIMSRIRP